jgi:hypothetical protein
MTTSIKTCFKCKKEKALDAYYKHSDMKDGHLNKCIDCTKADVRLHRRSDEYRERVLSYDRLRGNRQSKSYRDNLKVKNEAGYKARVALGNALRSGKIDKADRCEHCGADSLLHGHHHDYSQQLSVIWLCVPCHRQLHAFMDLVNKRKDKSA